MSLISWSCIHWPVQFIGSSSLVRSFGVIIYRILSFYFLTSFSSLSICPCGRSFRELVDRNNKCEVWILSCSWPEKSNRIFTLGMCLLCIFHKSLHARWGSAISGLLKIAFIIYCYLSSAFYHFWPGHIIFLLSYVPCWYCICSLFLLLIFSPVTFLR